MSHETNICPACGIHIFPGMSHFCKIDGDEEFLKPIRKALKRLENAEIAIKNIIETNIDMMAMHYPYLPKDFAQAMSFHIFKDLSEENVAWALLEIARRKETEERLKLPDRFKG